MFIYYPSPRTKPDNFKPVSTVEIIGKEIEGLCKNDLLKIKLTGHSGNCFEIES